VTAYCRREELRWLDVGGKGVATDKPSGLEVCERDKAPVAMCTGRDEELEGASALVAAVN